MRLLKLSNTPYIFQGLSMPSKGCFYTPAFSRMYVVDCIYHLRSFNLAISLKDLKDFANN